MALVLKSTATEQWQALINEAETACNVALGEDVESYLVFTLMRYTNQPRALEQLQALDYLDALLQQRHQQLRDVADRSIMIAGLFPGLAQRRLVSVNYFIEIAYSGYNQVANLLPNGSYQGLYKELSRHIIDMVTILSGMRSVDTNNLKQAELKAWRELLSQNPVIQ